MVASERWKGLVWLWPSPGRRETRQSKAPGAKTRRRKFFISLRDSEPERHDAIGQEREHVGEDRHIGELDRGPAPPRRFAPHHGDGGHALHGEGEEYQQCGR